MKILWVKAGKLLPVDSGGKIRSYSLLRELARRHEVTLLSYYNGVSDPEYARALGDEFHGALTIRTSVPSTTLAAAAHYASHVVDRAPYAVTKFTARPVRELLSRWMDENRFDVMVCDFLSASLNFPARLSTPTALFQHNVESALWGRQAAHEVNPVKRVAFRWEARRMAHYERETVRRFHHIIAVSEQDRVSMSTMTDPSRISVAPTGVDLSAYRVEPAQGGRSPLVVFVGSMDWEANIDGVEWFHREVWRGVVRAVPTARFRIVGRNPGPRIRRLAEDATVSVTGGVPSVVGHLREAAVVVVPLRIGGGTRLKIYEAMAVGRAVVATTIGAEGLDVQDGHDINIADASGAFTDRIIALLTDEQDRARIERNAAASAGRFDWPVVVRQFEASLASTIAEAARQRLAAPDPQGGA